MVRGTRGNRKEERKYRREVHMRRRGKRNTREITWKMKRKADEKK